MRRRRLPGERDRAYSWAVRVRAKTPILASAREGSFSVLDVKAHHVVTQQKLRRVADERRLTIEQELDLVWDVRNGVPVTVRRHDRHHSHHERITRAEVAEHYPEVLEFVVDNELEPWFERHYPETEAHL